LARERPLGRVKRSVNSAAATGEVGQEQTPVERRAAMTWAQRLKRVFNIDIETCRDCGGTVRVIACINDPMAIRKILTHRKKKGFYFSFTR